MYGVINPIASVIVITSFFFLLYICKKPIKMAKYVKNGDIPLMALSAARYTAWANSGENELRMNCGTITGDIIAHLVEVFGTNIVDIIIIINDTTISSKPVRFKLSNNSVRDTVINTPIFVSLNIAHSCEAKKIRTIIDEKLFK